jgi:hypothetical protein
MLKMKVMQKNKFIYIVFFTAVALATVSCKKQLQVGNPNNPTTGGNVNNESGLVSFAQGGVYINGFANGDVWLGDSYFSLPWGYSELMGDVLGGGEGSNNQTTTIGVPDYIIMDDGTKLTNSSPQIALIRLYNNRSATSNSNNVLYYQWLNMYALNEACNTVLSLVDNITFSGDATTRANTVKAWCYWWKGYAYASIGTLYYSGLVVNSATAGSSNYVVKDSIIAQSNTYLNMALNLLTSGVSSTGDYTTVLGELIPSFCQTGKGGVLTSAMWIRNINTMLARNILLNKLATFVNGVPGAAITKSSTTPMTTADWNNVLTYATNGIKSGDLVFTGRTVQTNYFFSATGGSVAAVTTGKNTNTTLKISERLIQDFNTGDKRLAMNFNTNTSFLNNYSFTTRYSVNDTTTGSTGVYAYGTKTVGAYELYMAGSYEENALMLAEANIWLGNTDVGLGYLDAVRSYQGAGVTAVANTGLTKALALAELVKERRVALLFRGLSFYDARRWGWTYDIANGGGSYGNTVVTVTGAVNTNATISYNFLDYWDVPADETDLNPAASGSAAIKNPNF